MSSRHWAETAVITVKPLTDADPSAGETTVVVSIDDGKEPFEFDITVKIGTILETLRKELNNANNEIIQLKSLNSDHIKQYESTRIQQLNDEIKSLRDSLGSQMERNRTLDSNLYNLNGSLSSCKNELTIVKSQLNETLQKLDSVQKDKKSDTDNIDYLKKELVNSRNLLSQAKSEVSIIENDFTNKLYTSKLEVDGVKKDLLYHKNELEISLNLNKNMKKELKELMDANRKLKDELSRKLVSGILPDKVVEKEYQINSSSSDEEEVEDEVEVQKIDAAPIATPTKAEEPMKSKEFIDPLTPLSDGFAAVGSFFTTFLVPDIIASNNATTDSATKVSSTNIEINTTLSPRIEVEESPKKEKKMKTKASKVKADPVLSQVDNDLTNRMLTSELAKYKDAEQYYREQAETLTYQLDDLTKKYTSVIATSVSGSELDRLYREIDYMKEQEKDKESQYNTKVRLYEDKAQALNVELTNYSKIITEQKQEIDNWRLQCNELSNKCSKFNQVLYELDNTKKELMSTKNNIIDYQAKMNQVNSVEVKLTNQNNSIIELNNDNNKLIQEIDSCKIQISELLLEKDRLIAANNSSSSQNVELSVLKGEILSLQTKVTSLEREKVQLERVSDNSGRVFKELNAAKTNILELQSKLTDLSLTNQRLQASYDSSLILQEELRECKRVNSELKITLNDLYKDSNKLKELEFTNVRVSSDSQNQIEIITQLKGQVDMLTRTNHSMSERCKEYDRVTSELSTTKYQILELRNQLNESNNMNKKLKEDATSGGGKAGEYGVTPVTSDKEQKLLLEIDTLNKFISELYTTNNKLLSDAKNDLNEFYGIKEEYDALLLEVEMLKITNNQLLLRCQYLSELEVNKQDMMMDVIRSYPKGAKSIQERINEIEADLVREEKERIILLELKNKEITEINAGFSALFRNKAPVPISVAEVVENHNKSTVDGVFNDVSSGIASVGSVFTSIFPTASTDTEVSTTPSVATGGKATAGLALPSIFASASIDYDTSSKKSGLTSNTGNESANGVGIGLDTVSAGVSGGMNAVGSFFTSIFPISPTGPTNSTFNDSIEVVNTPPSSSRRVSFSASKVEATEEETKKKKKTAKVSDATAGNSESSVTDNKKKKKKNGDTASVSSEPSVSSVRKKKTSETASVSSEKSGNSDKKKKNSEKEEATPPTKSALKKSGGDVVYRVDPSKVVPSTGYYDDYDDNTEPDKKEGIFSFMNPMSMFSTPSKRRNSEFSSNSEAIISATSAKYK